MAEGKELSEEVYGKVMDHVDKTGDTLRDTFTLVADLHGFSPSAVQQHFYRHKRTLNPRQREKVVSEYGGYTQLDDDAQSATSYEGS